MPSRINNRQELFRCLCKLWNDLYLAVPNRNMTKEETEATGHLLATKFSEILDEYLKSEEARQKVFHYIRHPHS